MIVSDISNISINFKDADFWINQHTGKPVKDFNPDFIGIKISETKNFDSKYMYYYCLNRYNQGTLPLNINVQSVKNMKLG